MLEIGKSTYKTLAEVKLSIESLGATAGQASGWLFKC